MASNTTDLEQFVKDSTQYLSFKDSPVLQFKYISASRVVDPFDKGKMSVEYVCEVDGKRMTLTKGSVRLARNMVGKEGKTVRVTKSGDGLKTQYLVEVID